jgi:hypothetical protein
VIAAAGLFGWTLAMSAPTCRSSEAFNEMVVNLPRSEDSANTYHLWSGFKLRTLSRLVFFSFLKCLTEKMARIL